MHTELESLLSSLSKETDPFELSYKLKKLKHYWDYPIGKIAKILKKHPSFVSSLINVALLPDTIKDGYYSGQISLSHLLIIARLKNAQDIREAYEEVLKNSLSISQTQNIIRRYLYSVDDQGDKVDVDSNLQSEKFLRDALDAKVRIYQSRVTAKITIEVKGSVSDTKKFIDKFVGNFSKEKVSSIE